MAALAGASEDPEGRLARLSALQAGWHEVEPGDDIRESAKRFLRIHDLRTAEALQIAAAFFVAETRPSSLEGRAAESGRGSLTRPFEPSGPAFDVFVNVVVLCGLRNAQSAANLSRENIGNFDVSRYRLNCACSGITPE